MDQNFAKRLTLSWNIFGKKVLKQIWKGLCYVKHDEIAQKITMKFDWKFDLKVKTSPCFGLLRTQMVQNDHWDGSGTFWELKKSK